MVGSNADVGVDPEKFTLTKLTYMKILIKSYGQYSPSRHEFISLKGIWVRYFFGKTEMYIGEDEGGGEYYELEGNKKRKVMEIALKAPNVNSLKSRLITFFNANK